MSDSKDGGLVFPCKRQYALDEPGMTLRDYFAAQALAGMLGGPMANSIHPISEKRGVSTATASAIASYEFADAMLEARKPK